MSIFIWKNKVLGYTPQTGGGGSSGGGSSSPTQTTVQNTNIPAYAQPYVETMLGTAQQQIFNYDDSGNVTSMKPYTPYSNNASDYIAGFSPLQQQAQSNIANMQVPGQYNTAMNFAQTAGLGAAGTANSAAQYGGMGAQAGLSYGQNATNPNAVAAYMNPYLQNTLAPSLQLQNQQFGQINAQNQGQATQQGAFGGGRQAVMQGLNQQNQMLAQNQLVGNAYNQAYNTANQNMQTAGAQAMQGAGLGLQGTAAQQAAYQQLGAQGANLANIAGQQTQSGLAINQAQEAAGAAQQAQQQNVINQQIQNYATAQQYPMMQLSNMSNLLRGLPMQSTTAQTYQAAPSAVSQLAGLGTTAVAGAKLASMKAGGLAKTKKFDVGGSVKHDLMQMAEADPQAFAQHLKTATSPEEKKIGQQVAVEMGLTAAAPNIRMAGGGIVAFASGGDADVDEYDDSPYEDAEDRAFAQRDAYNTAMVEQLAGMPITQSDTSSIGIKPEVKGAPQPLGYKNTDEFKKKIEHLESRGHDYDEKGNILTSHKGAKGRMQTMPNTLRDPGFGVKPGQSDHPEELARVGRDYADAMLARYKDPKLAAMAYNWGPGNVDKYIAGGMKGPVPGETRQYASNFAAGGIAQVKRFGLPDSKEQLVNSDDMSQIDALGAQLDETRNEVKGLNSFGSRQRPLIPDYDTKLKSATERQRALETQYEALINKQGMNKAAMGIVPGSMMPPAARKPNPFVQSQSAVPAAVTPTPPVVQPPKDNPPVLPPDQDPKFSLGTPPKAPEGPAGKDVQDTTDKVPRNPWEERYNDYISKKEAGLTSQKQEDKWMSILAAGLGMMGGTSPWAGVNIGKGGQEGVASMLSANKQRGAEEAALGKLYSQGYQTKESALSREEVARERTANRASDNQLAAYNTYQKNVGDVQTKREALFSKEMSSGSNAMLNARLEALNQKLIKDPNDAKSKAEYNSLMQQKQAIRNRIYSEIKEPSPPPGLKLPESTGVQSGDGWSVTKRGQ